MHLQPANFDPNLLETSFLFPQCFKASFAWVDLLPEFECDSVQFFFRADRREDGVAGNDPRSEAEPPLGGVCAEHKQGSLHRATYVFGVRALIVACVLTPSEKTGFLAHLAGIGAGGSAGRFKIIDF